jgi:hypothetical protein
MQAVLLIILSCGCAAQRVLCPPHSRGIYSTQTAHHRRQDSSGLVISSSQRPLTMHTHSQATKIHASDGIRTRNPRKRAATDRRLRPLGPLGPAVLFIRLLIIIITIIMEIVEAKKHLLLKQVVLNDLPDDSYNY